MKLIEGQQSAKTTSIDSAKTTTRPVQMFKPKIKFIPDASIFKNLGITSDNITTTLTETTVIKSTKDLLKSDPQNATKDVLKLDPQTASKNELQKLCENYGIAKSGTKKLLIERLIKNGVLKPENPEEEKNWSSKSKREELMVACSKRVLATDGSKSDLMQRLQQYEDTRTKLYIIGGGEKEEEEVKVVKEVKEGETTNDDVAVKKRRLSDVNELDRPSVITLAEKVEANGDEANELSKDVNDKDVDISDLLVSDEDDSQSEGDTDDELLDSNFEKSRKESGGDSDEEISFRSNDEEVSDDEFEKLYNHMDSNETKEENKDVEVKEAEENVTVISVCARKEESSPTQYHLSFVGHYVTLTDNTEDEEVTEEVAKEEELPPKPQPTFFAWGSFVNSSGSPEKVKFIS